MTSKPSAPQPYAASLWLQLSILMISFGFLFHHTIVKMVKDWSVDPNFSHGFLVPVISAYLVWQQKKILASIEKRSSKAGLAVIILGMGLHMVGSLGAELFTMRIALITTIYGTTLYFFGWPMTRAVTPPILYLVFMVPVPSIIWNKLAFPLQLFAANLTAGVVTAMQIPILREGNILHLANTTLQVIDACSGLRSLTSLLALSAAFAYLSEFGNIKKCVLFLSAIPIAVLINIVRLTVTVLMALHIGPEAAEGFLHELSGILVFIVALLLLYLTHMALSKIGIPSRQGA